MALLYKKTVIHILAVLTGIYILYYIWWRFANTINEEAFIFSIILLIAEVQGVINFFLFAMMTWNVSNKAPPGSLDGAI